MRDDVAAFARFLLNLLEEKRDLSHSLLDNEIALLSKITSHDTDEIQNLLEKNDSLIEAIDLLDFDIAGGKRNISSLLGVDDSSVDRTLSADESKEGKQYKEFLDDIRSVMTQAFSHAEKISHALEAEMKDTQLSIDASSIISRFRNIVETHMEENN